MGKKEFRIGTTTMECIESKKLYFRKIRTILSILVASLLAITTCSDGKRSKADMDKTLEHLVNSVEYENSAVAIINGGLPNTLMDIDKSEEMNELFKKALQEAYLVDLHILNSSLPKWGDKFAILYIRGLELRIEGHEKVNLEKSIEGQNMAREYKEWFNMVKHQ